MLWGLFKCMKNHNQRLDLWNIFQPVNLQSSVLACAESITLLVSIFVINVQVSVWFSRFSIQNLIHVT